MRYKIILVAAVILFTIMLKELKNMEEQTMSEQHRTKEEYIDAYAHDYCCDNKEEAKAHEIVKEVCEELKEE